MHSFAQYLAVFLYVGDGECAIEYASVPKHWQWMGAVGPAGDGGSWADGRVGAGDFLKLRLDFIRPRGYEVSAFEHDPFV